MPRAIANGAKLRIPRGEVPAGNVGYLDVRFFPDDAQMAGDTIASAVAFVANTEDGAAPADAVHLGGEVLVFPGVHRRVVHRRPSRERSGGVVEHRPRERLLATVVGMAGIPNCAAARETSAAPSRNAATTMEHVANAVRGGSPAGTRAWPVPSRRGPSGAALARVMGTSRGDSVSRRTLGRRRVRARPRGREPGVLRRRTTAIARRRRGPS